MEHTEIIIDMTTAIIGIDLSRAFRYSDIKIIELSYYVR